MAADFLVICGLSGAGRSQAAANLDDLGWFVIDNLPAPLIPKVGELAAGGENGFGHVALVVRTSKAGTEEITDALDQLPAASQDALIDLGLRCVVDLRWDHELEHRPSVFATSDRVRYASIPLLRDEFVDAGVAATYLHMLDTRAAALAEHAAEDVLEAAPAAAGTGRNGACHADLR